MKRTANHLTWCWIAPLLGAACALAQQDPQQPAEITKPLPAKQEMIRDRIRRLEDRMFRLYEKLAETEPENAAKLSAALERIGQAGVDQRVDLLVEMLADDARLLRAHDEQERLLADLEGVLALLMKRGDAEARKRRIQRLSQFHREVEELLEEQRRLANDDAPEATKQHDLAQKAGDLADGMKGGKQPPGEGQDQPQEPGGPSPDQPAPGQQNVEQARRHMDDAADDLDRGDRPSAGDDQEQAIEELDEARLELEEQLRQLRREEREELLRDLESRFAQMLAGQLTINGETTAVHLRGTPEFSRPDRLGIAELAEQQSKLSDQAATCLHILEEEGTTVAFPRVVEQIHRDMSAAADRMSDLLIGPLTQAIQEEVVSTLRDLIGAVQRMQEQDDQPVAQGEQQDGEAPLLPPSAELKLLKAAQLRINLRTAVTEQARQAGSEPQEQIDRAVRQLAQRQRELADIAAAISAGRE